MRHHESTSAPRCSACGARHYPATLGNGRRVWCDGTPAESEQEHHERTRARESANRRAEQEERDYIAWRREQERGSAREQERARAARAALLADRPPVDRPPIESWEALRAPDTMPDEI